MHSGYGTRREGHTEGPGGSSRKARVNAGESENDERMADDNVQLLDCDNDEEEGASSNWLLDTVNQYESVHEGSTGKSAGTSTVQHESTDDPFDTLARERHCGGASSGGGGTAVISRIGDPLGTLATERHGAGGGSGSTAAMPTSDDLFATPAFERHVST